MNTILEAMRDGERREVAFTLRVAEVRHHPIVRLAAKATQCADQPPMVAAALLAVVAGRVANDARLYEAGARVLAAAVAATALKSAAKRQVTRTRPNAVLDGASYERRLGGSQLKAQSAFPSGHTADAVAAARALARVYPEYAGAFWVGALFVAFTQVPAGAHYPSDIVAGAAVGLAGEAFSAPVAASLLRSLPLRPTGRKSA